MRARRFVLSLFAISVIGFAGAAYDTVNLLVDALGRAPSSEPPRIRDALAATQGFPGVVGPISYAPGERVPEKAVAVIGLDKGTLTPAWNWVPPAWGP